MSDVTFHDRDFLVFVEGKRKGLPENLLAKNVDNCLNHPGCTGRRSLNVPANRGLQPCCLKQLFDNKASE